MARHTRQAAQAQANVDQNEIPPPPQPPPFELIPQDSAVGTPLLLPKPSTWTRIYVQNPNGLSIGADGDISMAATIVA